MIINGKHPILIVLGWVTLVVNVLMVGMLIFRGDITKFLTDHWTISIFFAYLLLAVGLGLLHLGGDKDSLIIWGGVLGFASLVLSLSIYTYIGCLKILEGVVMREDAILIEMTTRRFTGLIALFLLTFSMGLAFFHIAYVRVPHYRHLLHIPSYGYAVATIFLIFVLVFKYVYIYTLTDTGIHLGMLTEAMFIVVGISIFMHLHTKATSLPGDT